MKKRKHARSPKRRQSAVVPGRGPQLTMPKRCEPDCLRRSNVSSFDRVTQILRVISIAYGHRDDLAEFLIWLSSFL